MSEPEKKRKSRKITTDWTDEKVAALIGSVEDEPVLWNATLQEYRNKIKRDSAWKNMSEVVFENAIGPSELNTKWQSLRCQYKDQLNRAIKKKSGQGTDENYTVRWKHYEQMKFLDSGDGSETTETTSNLMVSCFLLLFY